MDDEVVAARFGEAVSWLIRRPHEEQRQAALGVSRAALRASLLRSPAGRRGAEEEAFALVVLEILAGGAESPAACPEPKARWMMAQRPIKEIWEEACPVGLAHFQWNALGTRRPDASRWTGSEVFTARSERHSRTTYCTCGGAAERVRG